MPIDPKLRAHLDSLPPAPPNDQVTPDLLRARIAQLIAGLNFSDLPNIPTRDTHIPGSAGNIPVRIYSPETKTPAPVIVHFHGGGWVVGSLDTHDPFCRYLAELTHAAIVSVDYRLAPEHKFPAAIEDAEAATRWALAHAAQLGGNPQRVFVSGDSAGGNLAAAVAQLIGRDTSLRGQILLFPVTDANPGNYPSYQQNASGYGLERAAMQWFLDQYLDGPASRRDVRAAPILAKDLGKLPPALIMTGEYDVLRDEGMVYSARLREAGVEVTHFHFSDMHHNFPVWPLTVAEFPQSYEAREKIASWVRSASQ
ncbi:MAG: alpha/beta hydrolase [Acidobacteriaceae bacterium]